MALFSQEQRHITISTPLGQDVLLVETMRCSEGMSRLFEMELSLLSENQGINFLDIIGKGVTIAIDLPSGAQRYFHGIVSRFVQGSGSGTTGGDTRVSHYRATVVPWFWLLSRSAESRIYQHMSVPEIVEKVFSDHGFSDFQLKLQGSYRKREYCVQYRETHCDFVSRLLEEEGIHYFFEHANGKHKMIIADAPQANLPCAEQKSASYQIDPSATAGEDVILSLEKSQEIRPGKFSLNDYNFEIPNTALKVDLPGKYKVGPEREIYDYPGDYARKAEGDAIARVRMEEEEARITTVVGSSTCRAFASGYRFTLNNFYRKDMSGKEYVLTSIEHNASHAVQGGGHFQYLNSFTCIPADVPFRPPRITPRPRVQGVQTAIVVGPAGEEIYPDEHGRVKVQFHWDREGKRDEKSSCWIRVSQLWAGGGWGAMFIPRIGHEVIVDFLEGDPDRPIITGRVYHGTNTPPYPLPASKTKSTIKSQSTPGGGGSNELRFEDKKGSEEIFLHGQKDWTIAIENDKNQTVGRNETLSVGNNRTKGVKNDQSETIGGNKTSHVVKDFTETIDQDAMISIGKNETFSVEENSTVSIGRNLSEEIGEKWKTTVGSDMSTEVSGDSRTQVSGNMAIDVGKNLLIKAGDEITIQVGDASITMKASGDITVKGGKIILKASGDLVLKGSKITSN